MNHGKAQQHLRQRRCEGLWKGWWLARGQAGSHLILTNAGVRANLTVPLHSELAPGTLRALIRVSGLTVDEFLSLL
jgi:predicted RNA binding protein YcfA (HicA-like mRNA interferase family)